MKKIIKRLLLMLTVCGLLSCTPKTHGPKYEFTGKTMIHKELLLKQIVRVADGVLGGYIQSQNNLSQYGESWIGPEAKVYENARVYGDARVHSDAEIYGNAQVWGGAWVSGYAQVYENARVYGNAEVYGDARVYGDAWVYDDARVLVGAQVYGDAWVYGNARVLGGAQVYENAWVYGDAWVFGGAEIYGKALVRGNAQVRENARVYGKAEVSGDDHLFGNDVVTKGVISFKLLSGVTYQEVITVTDNSVSIGHKQHTLDYWLSNYKDILKEQSDKDLKVYGLLLEAIVVMRGAK